MPEHESVLSDGLRNAIHRHLAEEGISMRQLARDAGVSHSSLSRFLAGKREIQLWTHFKLRMAVNK